MASLVAGNMSASSTSGQHQAKSSNTWDAFDFGPGSSRVVLDRHNNWSSIHFASIGPDALQVGSSSKTVKYLLEYAVHEPEAGEKVLKTHETSRSRSHNVSIYFPIRSRGLTFRQCIYLNRE